MLELRTTTAIRARQDTESLETLPSPVEELSRLVSGLLFRAELLHNDALLLVGRDIVLQGTRATLLARAGFHCYLSAGAAEIPRLGGLQYKTAILCHTLPLAEACRAVKHVRVRSPLTPVLRLAKYPQIEDACFEHVLVDPWPDRLVATVQSLCSHARCSA